ncbi:hypothetical protein [Methylocaldum szegediense]|uniref:Uncharacterized protein n=1 Tax=Methylocaldum szegediense TaxID=73780 RepID=A0ABM9HY71_9GAMM|nr:hypothetical protein [Methylocaldum szegediense]CAI8764607.1 conserved protein of unknown function [Methylocaldum szegediense]
MRTSFVWGGLLSLVVSATTSVYGQSEFHALDKLSLQETHIASSRLDDSELGRVEGGLEVVSVSTIPVDLTSQVVMQATLLESTAQASSSSGTENRVDQTTSLIQVCGPPPCSQSLSQTTYSGF